MATNTRRGGILSLNLNGRRLDCKGSFTYNLGIPKREAIVGSDGVHGYKEMPQVPYIEGEITDRQDLDVAELCRTTGATLTLSLANGKTVVQRSSWFAGDGNVGSEEGNIAVRFEGLSAEEI